MHDEIAHMSVVDGPVGGVLPGVIGLRVIGEDADHMQRLEVAELHSVERGELTPEHEVEQLLSAPPCTAFGSHLRFPARIPTSAELGARGLYGPCARSRGDAEPSRSPPG